MKFTLNISLFLFSLIIFNDRSLSMTNYQIKKICEKEKSKSNCIKNFKQKRSELQKGNIIEIPVIPFKKK